MLLGCAPLKQGKRVVGLKKQEDLDFPGGPKVKNLPDSAEDTVRSLLLEESTCHRATKPIHQNYRARAPEPTH